MILLLGTVELIICHNFLALDILFEVELGTGQDVTFAIIVYVRGGQLFWLAGRIVATEAS